MTQSSNFMIKVYFSTADIFVKTIPLKKHAIHHIKALTSTVLVYYISPP